MKRFCFILGVAVMMLLTGCCAKHKWEDAICTTPKRCVKCGKTVSSVLYNDEYQLVEMRYSMCLQTV